MLLLALCPKNASRIHGIFCLVDRIAINLVKCILHATSGKKARADILSPALGHTTHVPMYRAKWGGIGTLHRRYGGCLKNMRAKPLMAQSEEFRNMEFYHQAMSNGLEITADRYRK